MVDALQNHYLELVNTLQWFAELAHIAKNILNNQFVF